VLTSSRLGDVGANRIHGANELRPDRPLIEPLPARHGGMQFVSERNRRFVGGKALKRNSHKERKTPTAKSRP
jgi:hypothetical protein